MIRGNAFYAIWNSEIGLWSTDEYDVTRLVDKELWDYVDRRKQASPEDSFFVMTMGEYSSGSWKQFKGYLKNVADNSHQLDPEITFADTVVKKNDYRSKRLPYSLKRGSIASYDELIGTLYNPDERQKIEWGIGSVISGDSRDIQKFFVFYGDHGTGKSTILNLIQKLFEGYYTTFEAKALTSSSNAFSTEVFKNDPLVAIQHDGDLSRIEDNTKLNSIVSHEEMTMNEKYKSSYTSRVNCMLFVGTNKPVRITDAKSGLIRRLIDVTPTGDHIPSNRYQYLVGQLEFELGAIAQHCLDVYLSLGKHYYDGYRPTAMMLKTDIFYNFVEASYLTFKEQGGVSLSQAYEMYKAYCDEALVDYKLAKYKFREELKNYFSTFYDRYRLDGKQIRSYYEGFLSEKFDSVELGEEEPPNRLVLDQKESIFDKECSDCIAQYAKSDGTPKTRWDDVKTKLSDLDTRKLHYVRVPLNHIVIDFDLKDSSGEKSAERNLEAAGKWPATYAEFSKGGAGVHLHYIYDGDPTKLSRVYEEGIEIKVFGGKSSLRRKLSLCNKIPIAHISSGLPTVKGGNVLNFDGVKSERKLRELIQRNLNKEIHPGTKPSVDFIYKLLEDAYSSGLKYDVRDLRPKILSFANNSTHQSPYCVKLVSRMKFHSEETSPAKVSSKDDPLVFFDVEVFPNLFLVNWKYEGSDSCVRMINPTPSEIEDLLHCKLVGFNCRRYDNHILYGRYIGYSNEQLYDLSQKIVTGSRNCMFGEAYNISYTDVYDFSSKKQSLKKFEIELGIHHQELGLPWDQPVPEEDWIRVAEYCDNDVIATEAVFNARKADWLAREILADLAGGSVNDTTNMLTTKIIFGNERHPQLVYTDLSETFPGYEYAYSEADKKYHNLYRGTDVGFGGYVYAEPGMYGDVALLDVQSMHPSSIIAMNCFGDYTSKFKDIYDARIAIKHRDFEKARTMLGGRLAPYLKDEDKAGDLAQALKIAINSVYGLTSASFDNPFRDIRNKNNIVALRGALFMRTLQDEVQRRGFIVAHIKTDSIKIPNATPEIIEFVMEFGKKYGYIFEHEATYDKMCLVNNAVYIARYRDGKHAGEWTATGAQFAHPYIFKTLFSKEPLEFKDLCETKTVQTALYLDMNERNEEEHDYVFVGKAGSFCPIKPGCGGGLLVREKNGEYYAATGSKGYRWLEAEAVKAADKEDEIDYAYFNALVDEAVVDISKYGDFEWFCAPEPYSK
ncbi:MAG: DNA polymerase [Chaetfec virus UA24_144]|nr:MAG: DNA polymerase [Chaetfec virus UA24_144]